MDIDTITEKEETQLPKEFGIPSVHLRQINDWLDAGEAEKVRGYVRDLHAADIADLIEKLDSDGRERLLDTVRADLPAMVFSHLDEQVRAAVLARMSADEIGRIVAELRSDDALDLIEDLDKDKRSIALKYLSVLARAFVEEGLTFPEESAGRLMCRELIAIPEFWTVTKTLRYLRMAGESLPDNFLDIYIVDPMHQVKGVVPLSRLIRASRNQKVGDIAQTDVYPVAAETDQEDVGFLFRKYGLSSAPVIDSAERLIGIITADDVLEIVYSEAGEDILKLGGVSEDDIYAAAIKTSRSRFSWLGINLVTAIAASVVIGLFEATIDQVVALAVLMPIVASMGGNAGTQTLTVAVRALATKELGPANALRVVGKETLVGAINGVLFALIASIVVMFWFRDPLLGVVIGLAMIVNLLVAGLAGALIPLGLNRIRIDPAVASSVVLTTITDVVGFFVFLGLASIILF
ncbi:MAG: magnesium transporter [Pseudomonadota bacterium]|nr:magnesium transporter [Pseudomonadota bacterium]